MDRLHVGQSGLVRWLASLHYGNGKRIVEGCGACIILLGWGVGLPAAVLLLVGQHCGEAGMGP